MKKRAVITFLMTLLGGWVCAQPAYDFAPLTAQIQQWVDKGYYSGASMLIIKNDKQVYEVFYGLYSLLPDSISTFTLCGSQSKS